MVSVLSTAVPAPPIFRFLQTNFTAMEGDFLSLVVERVSLLPRDYDVVLTQISLQNNPQSELST